MQSNGVTTIVEKHSGERGALISILEDIQSEHGYLPAEALREVAECTGRRLVDIYGVATFYRFFSLKPRGEHLCSVCLGTACHVRGAPAVAGEIERQLKVKAGETTADNEFTVKTVNCLGACALGPVVVMDGHYFSAVNTSKVKQIIEQTRAGLETSDAASDRRIFPLSVNCSRCNHSLMTPDHPLEGSPSIRVGVASHDQRGWLWLSSLYGSGRFESEREIAEGTVVDFFCPHCYSELRGAGDCPECGGPMASMVVPAGGVLQVCLVRGCKGHMLDLS